MDVSAATGLVYEVNLEVEAGIAADYRAWLRGHVTEILGLTKFVIRVVAWMNGGGSERLA